MKNFVTINIALQQAERKKRVFFQYIKVQWYCSMTNISPIYIRKFVWFSSLGARVVCVIIFANMKTIRTTRNIVKQ